MSFAQRREHAIKNYKTELLDSLKMNFNDKLRFNTMDGVSLTAKEVLIEMLKDPPTREGLSLIEVWARPKQEIDRIVREAASGR